MYNIYIKKIGYASVFIHTCMRCVFSPGYLTKQLNFSFTISLL